MRILIIILFQNKSKKLTCAYKTKTNKILKKMSKFNLKDELMKLADTAPILKEREDAYSDDGMQLIFFKRLKSNFFKYILFLKKLEQKSTINRMSSIKTWNLTEDGVLEQLLRT